jgi:LPXTG-motif cell wall-anchored protein
VDRIPSIQLDMDFVDQPGLVLLPVMSQVQPLDATDASVPNRPCDELALTLTMDEREWKDGSLVVEINARGQGIIPELDEMFIPEHQGFSMEVVDSGLSVTQLVSDGRQRIPQADRNWQITYRRLPDLRGDVTFSFPKLKDGIKPASMEYKRFVDADLATLDAATAAAGVRLSGSTGDSPRYLILIAIAAAIAAAWFFLKRRKTTSSAESAELAAPAEPTPFTTILFLRRLGKLRGSRLSPTDQAALESEISKIEAAFFSGGPPPAIDLPAITHKWRQVAGI